MSEDPEPAAAIYTTIQSSGVFKLSSVAEGFLCSGILVSLSAILVIGATLWTYRAHPEGAFTADLASFAGRAVGQFLFMAGCLSPVLVFRARKNAGIQSAMSVMHFRRIRFRKPIAVSLSWTI